MSQSQPNPSAVERCPLCGSAERGEFASLEWRGYPLDYALCQGCGLVYQVQRQAGTQRRGFYRQDYRRIYQGTAEPVAKDLYVQTGRARVLLEELRASGITRLGRTLDVGCSTGALLEALSQAYGCQAVGIEPGEAYRQHAGERGYRVYASIESLQAAETEPFDLISLVHVLEHLPDPLGSLRRLGEDWIAPGGWLLVEVPNLYAHDSFELAHLVCYSRHTLVETVQAAGFRVRAVWSHGRPRSRLLPLYLTLLAQPEPGGQQAREIRPERFVERKRQAGMLFRRVVQRIFPHQAWVPLPGEME